MVENVKQQNGIFQLPKSIGCNLARMLRRKSLMMLVLALVINAVAADYGPVDAVDVGWPGCIVADSCEVGQY